METTPSPHFTPTVQILDASPQPRWQRTTLLSVLVYETAGALLGGCLLAASPDGRLMDMPTYIMHGVFTDFLVPSCMLIGLGILNFIALIAVYRRTRTAWVAAGLALGGLTIWFGIEIAVLEELHWLHIMWGLPVIIGDVMVWSLVPPHLATMRNALLLCGMLSSFLYILAIVLGGLRWEGYDPASQTVSELFGIGAPSAPLVIPIFVVYSLLILLFSTGIWMSAGGKRTLRIAAVLIAAKEVLGLFGTFLTPIHLRGIEPTGTDAAHAIVTAIGVLGCMFPAIGFGGVSFGKAFRAYSILTMVVFVVFGTLAGLDGPRMAANEPTPFMGIWERINIVAYMIWIVVFAAILMRSPSDDPSTPSQ